MRPSILVVDDDPHIAELVSEALEDKGFRVTYCTDARQALIQAQGLKTGLLILDIMMPVFGTGIDAYENIRKNKRFSKDLPIIFLTALKPGDAAKIVPKGDPKVRLLHKPTTLDLLYKTVIELTGNSLISDAR